MRPEAALVVAFVRRVERRLALRAGMWGAAAGLATGALASLFGASGIMVGLIFAVIGLIIGVLIQYRDGASTPRRVERAAASSRNRVITAYELAGLPSASRVHELVIADAARFVSGLNPSDLFPARAAYAAFVAALGVSLIVSFRASLPIAIPGATGPSQVGIGAPLLGRIEVVVTPPAYTGRPPETLRDPVRIQVLAGSRVQFSIHSNVQRLSFETLDGRDTLGASDGRFAPAVVATADGYVALQPIRDGQTGPRRLIGLSVLPDAAPKVKITAPGHDLLLPNGRRTIAISVEADDDIGLASLKLRYTKVSGSGERFTFVEGEVPLSITRIDARAWKATASWRLDPLALEAGDMVVYRAVAADARPGAQPSESDAFIAEVVSPGGEAAAGFAVDPEQERYAVSQQMVILKTERLIAKRSSIPADDFANEAHQIAAEQRKVRAEFVFMLGGELADAPDAATSMTEINEEAEAAGEEDLLAGRNANAGHVALLRAIRAMSRAAAALTVAQPDTALPHERTALTNLESAFSRARILLRALATRERLDLTRRLTGSMIDATGETHPRAQPVAAPRVAELRRVLAGINVMTASRASSADAAAEASLLAERVLRVDASAKGMQDAASELNAAAQSFNTGRPDRARASLDRAVMVLSAELRRDLPDAAQTRSVSDARLNAALMDALRQRRPGGTP